MTTREKILSMRMNEFGFSMVSFFGSKKDVFPERIHIVKYIQTEPTEVYSIDKHKYITITQHCFVIAELSWNYHEPCWDFKSIGTRYLEHGTEELNKWILDFCNKYEVKDGELVEIKE